MKFNDMHYERPDIQGVEANFRELLSKFSSAETLDEQVRVIEDVNALRNHFMSMFTLASIRNSIDTRDDYYREEKSYFNQVNPTFESLEIEFRRAITSSEYRKELEETFGSQLFRISDLAVQFFSPVIIEDLQQNNELVTEYNKLVASAKIPFDGQELTLSQLGKYLNVPDRAVRKAAYEARYGFFASHEEEFDDIYDRMVRVRTNMAKKLGYDNFVKMGYARMNRTDYGSAEVAAFREQVKKSIVPLAEKLRERQRIRIGVDSLHYYDNAFDFASGNPAPKGNPDWIVENGRKMYSELSPETNEFMSFMIDNELMDLLSKDGKRVGGYCDIIPGEKAPFIFANFNGTAHDVTVLTHEAGHAFQTYCSRNYSVLEYLNPTLEAAEIHSMSMEFLTWDWMHLFFEDDTAKFKFSHLSGAIGGLPYVAAVDEFQHFVYEHPEASPTDRKTAWRNIERTYLPHRNYAENEYLERGGFWHQQLHIFNYPFYYVDYALAQICALQFWQKMHENREGAWNDYLHLCRLGGTKSFVDLVREANLISPFESGCVESVIGEIEHWLDSVNDKEL